MENYFGTNSAAWSARSGVVLDPEKNGPMMFNGAPNMNMVMSQAMMMQGQGNQQGISSNTGLNVQGESENTVSRKTSEDVPSQINDQLKMKGVSQSGNKGTPQLYGGNLHATGLPPGINPNMMSMLNTMTPQSAMNPGLINMMSSNGQMMNLASQGVPGPNTMGSSITSHGIPNMAGLPVMNANIPPGMFMHTVNFDSSQNQEDINRTMETSMDMLEQQQAVEQAKLLQRFKELRQLQIQQQEVLMKQQQNQLESLRSEQHNVQSMMVKQRKNQWGGQVVMNRDTTQQTRTPPQRQRPHNQSKIQQSQQSFADSANQSSLPCPVMYVPLNEDIDEQKTNPDLFSDTNSHVGSQCTEDGFHQLPDSASEVGEMPQIPNKKPVSRVSGILSSMKKSLTEELEQDEGFGTQSFRSSGQADSHTHMDPDTFKQSGKMNTHTYKQSAQMDPQTYKQFRQMDPHTYKHTDLPDGMDEDQDEDDSTQLEEQFLDQERDDEDEDLDEDYEEEEDDVSDNGSDDEQIRNKNLDDRPVAGIGEKKTFEELLEEQLKAEEEKLNAQALQGDSQDSPKRCFLKKGQGIARFGLQSKSKPVKDLKSVKPKVDSNSAQQNKSSKTESHATQSAKSSKGDNLTKQGKTLKGENSTRQQKNAGKEESTGPKKRATWTQRNTLNLKTSPGKGLKLQKSPNQKENRAMKNQPVTDLKLQKSPNQNRVVKNHPKVDSNEQKQVENRLFSKDNAKPPLKEDVIKGRQPFQKSERNFSMPRKASESDDVASSPDPFPDDASFVAKIHERKINEEVEKEDLDEFELLENCADNMSFCSQSSFVTRILQKDKLKHDSLKHPQSPRQSVAAQLQATIKNATQQQQTLQQATHVQKDLPSNKIDEPKSQTKPNQHEVVSGKQVKHDESDESSEEESSEEDDESEEETSDETESDDDSEDDSDEELPKSPTKIMTRKVASQNTVSNLLQKLWINPQDDSVASLNASSYVPNPKSPIVISKDVTTANKTESNIQDESLDEVGFTIHSQISSLRKSTESTSDDCKNDSDDSENSYSNLKIIPKNMKYVDSDTDDKLTSDSDVKLKSESDDKHSSDFDDEEEWADTTLKAKSPSDKQHKTSSEDDISGDGTPPTSKLVAKLFPKLKPQPSKQQIQDQQKLQTVTTAAANDGIQSKVLRDKLAELEKEIEKFRGENVNLEKLRKDREDGLQRLKKEIVDFEKEKNLELNRIQEYKNEEMKKLKHEKKMFEKYQKAARDIPNKKEREEIETLKNQLVELQEEMKRKETRWTSSNSRLRSKIEQLEQENSELKEEIKLMEKRRLEWLQKEQNKGKTKSAPRSSTPTQLHPTQNSADFQTTDSDEEKDPVRDSSSSKTSSTQMSLRPTQSSTQVRASNIPTQQSTFQPVLSGPGKTGPPSFQPGPNRTAQPSFTSHPGQPRTAQPNVTGPSKITQPSNTAQSSLNSHAAPTKGANSNNSQQKFQENFLRMSLMEDVPRGGTVSAVPQDTSLYTDTECDTTNNGNVPRKTATKYSVDRSMIDKGNNGYDEFQHADGKIERIYKTGAREILFPNGTRKEISADGKSIVVSFFNGDIKQITPDQRVVYYYAEAQTTHSHYPDGLEVLQFPNNQVEKHYPDGTKEITFVDQTIKYLFPNGSEESIFPDGTVIRVDKNGDKTMEFPNGQREIHTNEYKKREYPDGTVKTVYPDGRQETRYSNGRIRVKDRDGNVIVDRRC